VSGVATTRTQLVIPFVAQHVAIYVGYYNPKQDDRIAEAAEAQPLDASQSNTKHCWNFVVSTPTCQPSKSVRSHFRGVWQERLQSTLTTTYYISMQMTCQSVTSFASIADCFCHRGRYVSQAHVPSPPSSLCSLLDDSCLFGPMNTGCSAASAPSSSHFFSRYSSTR